MITIPLSIAIGIFIYGWLIPQFKKYITSLENPEHLGQKKADEESSKELGTLQLYCIVVVILTVSAFGLRYNTSF